LDLTTDAFDALIGQTLEEQFRELMDPDFGLELREDFVKALEVSSASKTHRSLSDVGHRRGV